MISCGQVWLNRDQPFHADLCNVRFDDSRMFEFLHALQSTPAGRGLPIHYVINPPSGTPDCHFVCGFFGCDATPFNPLLSLRATTARP